MSASIILDASVSAAWCFENESDARTDALLDRIRDEGGLVPALWHWEVSNALAIAVRRKRLSADAATLRLAVLAALPITTDLESQSRAWRETFLLAQAHNLTAYDASYLELAQRTGFELASKDADLCAAAKAIGVTLAL